MEGRVGGARGGRSRFRVRGEGGKERGMEGKRGYRSMAGGAEFKTEVYKTQDRQ